MCVVSCVDGEYDLYLRALSLVISDQPGSRLSRTEEILNWPQHYPEIEHAQLKRDHVPEMVSLFDRRDRVSLSVCVCVFSVR